MKAVLPLILLLFLACTGTDKDTADLNFEFTGQFKSVTLPEHFDQFNLLFRTFSHGGIAFYDTKANELWADSVGSLDSFKLIALEKEGPNGVGPQVEDIQLDVYGNIWISSMSSRLIKVNADGQVVERVELNSDTLNRDGAGLMTFSFVPEAEGSFAIATVPLLFQWNKLAIDQILQLPNVVRYDPKSGAFEHLSKYDAGFVGTNLNKHIIPTLHRAKGEVIVVNHNFRDIWVIEGKEIRQYPAAHSKFPKDPPISESDIFEDMEEVMRIMNFADIYSDFHYLPSLNLYVRVAKFEDIPTQGPSLEPHLAAAWGLVFLDSNFNVIGELDLPAKKYNPTYLFATEAGIWVSTTHPDNPDVEEGVITFELIQINL